MRKEKVYKISLDGFMLTHYFTDIMVLYWYNGLEFNECNTSAPVGATVLSMKRANMNIALFADTAIPIVDGVGRVIKAYAEHINKKGHKCFVAVPDADRDFDDNVYQFEILRFAGIHITGTQYKFGMPFADIGFMREVDRRAIDIVHVHSPFTAGLAGHSIARKRNIPVVATFHSKYYDDFYKYTHMKVASEIGIKYVVEYYKKCDEVWAVSAATAETLKEYGYVRDIVTMLNGADPKVRNVQEIEKVRIKYSLGGSPVILYVGQMDWKKNILHIINTCSSLRDIGLGFKLVFAGQGPDEAEIRKKVEELHLSDNTVFCGHIYDQQELDALYFSGDLFFFPSYYDNAPMVVREAAAAGLPCILARGSNSSEIIEDKVNGLLGGERAKDDAEMIAGVLARPEYLAQLRLRAKASIPVYWEDMMDNALDRYSALIKTHPDRKR